MFETGDTVFCKEEFETLKVGSSYKISGMGDLSMIRGSEKKGFGFSIEDDRPTWGNYKRKVKKSPIFYFFKKDEMSRYFMSDEEYQRVWKRDQKINYIING
jgi:hypothetical protein